MVLDTDIVIRYLTNDDAHKAERFATYLRKGVRLYLSDVTFAEIYWTLKSYYEFPKDEIITALTALLSSPSIQANTHILQKTLTLLKKENISLIDSYSASVALNQFDGNVLSYDKDFEKIDGVTRHEP